MLLSSCDDLVNFIHSAEAFLCCGKKTHYSLAVLIPELYIILSSGLNMWGTLECKYHNITECLEQKPS